MFKTRHNKNEAYNAESGNVLFLILIAVALFAALSYAVTQSSRSGGGDAGSETNLVNSSTITQYPAAVRTSILRMIVSQGADVTALEFNPPSGFGSCTSNALCVFHPTGGNATRAKAPADVMADGNPGDWIFTSDFAINEVGLSDATNASNDIIAFLPGVKGAVCQKINSELGITVGTDADSDGVPDAGILIANIPVAGDEMDNGNTGIGPAAAGASKRLTNDFDGQAFGCADFDATTNQADDSDLVYYHVLMER